MQFEDLEKKLKEIILEKMKFDPAHDINHIERVVVSAKRIAFNMIHIILLIKMVINEIKKILK